MLVESDITTFRFNFRGVGRSRGAQAGLEGGIEDVARAVDFLASDKSVGKIIVVGYSYGAAVGLAAGMGDDRVSALIGIAPPTAMDPCAFIPEIKKPLLIVCGSQDEFCDPDLLKGYLKDGGGKFEIIPGADHFFIGNEQRIGELAATFVKENCG